MTPLFAENRQTSTIGPVQITSTVKNNNLFNESNKSNEVLDINEESESVDELNELDDPN